MRPHSYNLPEVTTKDIDYYYAQKEVLKASESARAAFESARVAERYASFTSTADVPLSQARMFANNAQQAYHSAHAQTEEITNSMGLQSVQMRLYVNHLADRASQDAIQASNAARQAAIAARSVGFVDPIRDLP